MRASNAVSKTYGSTIFQRMWRNGHERTRNDTRCDPALAADISDVNDGRFRHFVTERPARTLLPSARTSHLIRPFALSSPPGGRPPKGFAARTSHVVPRTLASQVLSPESPVQSPPTLARLRPLRYHHWWACPERVEGRRSPLRLGVHDSQVHLHNGRRG